MRASVRVTVPGLPQPQGSTKGFIGRGRAAGRVLITTDNSKLYPWRLAIRVRATEVWGRRAIETGPVALSMAFTFPRPRGHFGKRGLLPSAPLLPTVRPDLDKCVRAVLDALKGSIYRDDAQVRRIDASKWYEDDAHRPGLDLVITVAEAEQVTRAA